MSNKPSEVYERLKDLRRQGDGTEIRSRIGQQLKAIGLHGLVRKEDEPDDTDAPAKSMTTDQLWALHEEVAARLAASLLVYTQESLIRALEIRALADRVFGDGQRAEAWLQRPNGSLSGQKPADLLNDELGTAVVREMLERIDSGIFA